MDYFKKYLAGEPGKSVPSGAETIEKLCDRVKTSTLLDDRRDAVRALKSLSRKFRLEVGTRGLSILTNVLSKDRGDTEIISHALECLYHVVCNEEATGEDVSSSSVSVGTPDGVATGDDLGGQFAEVFVKETENVGLLLSLLDEYDFHVRLPTVRLLTALLAARPRLVQEAVLISPMGVSKLTDLLSDSREVVRNDALLLLARLVRGNASIQKIVAFENAFERVLSIAHEEGLSDGGVVVEDCLRLLLGLLKDNKSNQTFFVEGSYVQRLKAFFEPEALATGASVGGGWSAQKVSNMHFALQSVRALVSPSGAQRETAACQRLMGQCGLLQQLCAVLMASGIPADVLTTCISAVAEAMRGNAENQAFFAGVVAPSTPPRPAIVVLLMSMVNDKQPLALRNAVLYCFQCFLYRNDGGQSQVVQTLLPSVAEASQVTAGQLLVSGLFSADPLSAWYAAVALLHAVLGGGLGGARAAAANKEALLRVQLTTSLGNPPVSLLQQCMNILTATQAGGGSKLQTKIGLLMFLITWLSECPTGVALFLAGAGNVSYLTSQVTSNESEESDVLVQGLCAALLGACLAYGGDDSKPGGGTSARDNVQSIVEKRIGLELFADRLSQVSKHESYSLAAKKPYISCKQPSEVLFDHEFTILYKSLEMDILKAAHGKRAPLPATPDSAANEASSSSIKNHDSIVTQYKELIREQDAALAKCRADLAESKVKVDTSSKEVRELRDLVQQLKDQNALLKAHKAVAGGRDSPVVANGGGDDKLAVEVERLQKLLAERDAELVRITAATALHQQDEQQLSKGIAEQEATELDLLRQRLAAMDVLTQQSSVEVSATSEKLSACEARLEEAERAAQAAADLQMRLSECRTQLVTAEGECNYLKNELELLRKSSAEKEAEADDLLVLLEEQSQKLEAYREKLRSTGVAIESDGEEEAADEDEGGSADEA